jgi:protocatechuate 3,4-dioxygenase beta subunit
MKIARIFNILLLIFTYKFSFAQSPTNSYYINKKPEPQTPLNEIMQYPQEPKVADYNDLELLKNVEESTLEKNLAPFSPHTPTPSRLFTADLSMPETFGPTNNLAKKVGSFYRAYGEIIFIQGTITDSFGIPIHNAVIEIWQTNSAGKYHTLLENGSGYVDKFFSMSGRAITDNLGNYHFITIMPGATAGRAPHINMNIYHPRFGRLETEMYFMNHPYNFGDFQYMSYTDEERILLTANVRTTDILNPKSIKIATFNITLKGIHQYKKL